MAKARARPRRGATNPVDVPGYVKEHPDFTMCRLWNHPWKLNGALEYQNGLVLWPLVCVRCGTEQTLRTGKNSGVVEHRKYGHAEG
jgi:hypothetical protein